MEATGNDEVRRTDLKIARAITGLPDQMKEERRLEEKA